MTATSTPTQKVVRVLLIFYLLGYFLFFLYSIYLYSQSVVIRYFMWSFLFLKATSLFVANMLPLTVSAVMLAYSLFFKVRDIYDKNGVPRPFNQLVVSPIIFFVVLTVIYTVLSIGFLPVFLRKIDDKEYLSRLAKSFSVKWEQKLKAKNYRDALRYMELYLTIDRNNREVRSRYTDLRLKVMTSGGREKLEGKKSYETGNGESIEDVMRRGDTAVAYLRDAEAFFDREDYFSAHYYARLALKLDPALTAAKRLMAKAWDRISGLTSSGAYPITEEELKRRELYRKKKEGYVALLSGDYIDSYYIFNDLKKEYPNDPDVKVYLDKAREKLSTVAFFSDEIKEVLNLPGYRDILFVNGNEGNIREIIYIGKLIPLSSDVYLENIEVLGVDKRFGIVYHLRAPYGKLLGQTILTKCIDRNDKHKVFEATYLFGRRKHGLANIIRIKPTLVELEELKADYKSLDSMDLASLWRVRGNLERYGLIEKYVDISILAKLLNPFSFLILSLFGISIGWFFRARYISKPPFFTYLFIPFLPVIVFMFVTMYGLGNRILFSFLTLMSGFIPALSVMIVVQAILLFFAIVFVAGQRAE